MAEHPDLDKAEAEIANALGSKDKLKSMWNHLDYNGNGIVSVAEVDKWLVSCSLKCVWMWWGGGREQGRYVHYVQLTYTHMHAHTCTRTQSSVRARPFPC